MPKELPYKVTDENVARYFEKFNFEGNKKRVRFLVFYQIKQVYGIYKGKLGTTLGFGYEFKREKPKKF